VGEAIQIEGASQDAGGNRKLNLRCPACRHEVTTESLGKDSRAVERNRGGWRVWGSRKCANPECGALLLFHYALDNEDEVTFYPAETIDFDATGLPNRVLEALEEAIKCHANECYVASAIMVRKTLEALCDDRGAKGGNLVTRLEALRGKIVLPDAMFAALHDLRALGNDAAHVELKDFDQIDRREVEVALAVTKEILKATYQYESMMSELAALKKQPERPV
jgi:hypothetical protein